MSPLHEVEVRAVFTTGNGGAPSQNAV
jgi:hypothetical protein